MSYNPLDDDEAFRDDRADEERYPVRGAAALPPPPTPRPQEQGTRLTAVVVLSVCEAVRGFMPLGTALKAHGVHLTWTQLEERATRGADPFWPWAVECLRMSEASAVAVATSKLYGIATDDGHKKQLDALKLFLSTRTRDFTPSQKVEVDHNHTGTVTHVTSRTDDLLRSGELSLTELANRLHSPRALPEPPPVAEDVDFEVVPEGAEVGS